MLVLSTIVAMKVSFHRQHSASVIVYVASQRLLFIDSQPRSEIGCYIIKKCPDVRIAHMFAHENI